MSRNRPAGAAARGSGIPGSRKTIRSTSYRRVSHASRDAVRKGPPPTTGKGASGASTSAVLLESESPDSFGIDLSCEDGGLLPGELCRSLHAHLTSPVTLGAIFKQQFHGGRKRRDVV